MFKMIREARREEGGAAMITALLFVIVMLFLVSSISVTAISGLQKAKESQEGTNLSMVVDSAISNALSVANNPAPINSTDTKDIGDFQGLAKAAYGVSNSSPDPTSDEGKYKWLWYTEGVKDAVVGESYDIIAIAYKDQPNDVNAKTVRVRLQAMPTMSATYKDNGKIAYGPTLMGSFSYGLLGTNGVTIGDGATVKSYNSALQFNDPTAADDTRIGTVSSNANILVNGTDANSVSRIILLDGNSLNIPYDRCTTSANCDGKIESFAYGVNLAEISNEVIKKCPNGASSYPDWKASVNGGVINPATQGTCFNNMIFDQDTDVAQGYSSGKPVELFIAGNITVNAGIEVNQRADRRGPLALRIYSAAGTNAKFNSGTVADPTKFSGMVEGHNFACSDSGVAAAAGKKLIFKGALACNTISFAGGTQAWWDQQTVQVLGVGLDRSIKTVWTPTSYEAQYNG
jgi:hypothetical protein